MTNRTPPQMTRLLTCATILCLAAVACNKDHPSPPRQEESSPAHTTPPGPSKVETSAVPAVDPFSIIEQSILPGIKRALVVRLTGKVDEQTLRRIALKLKAQDSRAYERTLIVYYLPGMPVGHGAWATTHFNPELEVKILGLTSVEENKLISHPEPKDRKVVGRWLDESLFVGSRITIFHEAGKLFLEQAFKDGSILKKEIAERATPLGRRFDKVTGSRAGDHWLLDSTGNLQIRDNDGLINTAKRIE